MERVVTTTSAGPVELAVEHPDRPLVLVCPGGHCDASTDVGFDLFRQLGLEIVSVSRPGYGRTEVGGMSAAEFVHPLSEALGAVGVARVRAVVGASFGGLQAVEFARRGSPAPEALILASAAPSTLPYPDGRLETFVAPFAFHPRVQRLTWALVRRLVRTDVGLRVMASSLSRLPTKEWWPTWSESDRQSARAMFDSMGSGSGFLNDLWQARADGGAARRRAFASVAVPALVLGSVHDGGVSFAHAEDQAATIPGARLVRTGARSHLYWLGGTRELLTHELARFLEEPRVNPGTATGRGRV